MRDRAAHGHARADVEQRQYCIEHRAADVFEIHVDAVRAGCGKPLAKVWIAAVEAGIEAERFDRVAALVGAAGDADRARPFELRDLANDLPHRTGCAGHEDHIARFQRGDLQQADPRSETGRTQHAEIRLRWQAARIELRDFCRDKLANYKVPRRVIVRADLPTGPTGKLLKRKLKELL